MRQNSVQHFKTICYRESKLESIFEIFLIIQPKHVLDTQKNRLNETALLSTQNKCIKTDGKEINCNFYIFIPNLLKKGDWDISIASIRTHEWTPVGYLKFQKFL